MKFNIKFLCLILLTIALLVIAISLKRVPQDLSYHDFADKRPFFGISNCLNVISNFPFAFIGGYGLSLLKNAKTALIIKFINAFLFAGILLTGIGSAYYHWHPDNDTLIWDRIPMTVVFMAFLVSAIAELVNVKLATVLFWPLILAGVGSVLWWQYTESIGQGDLRSYAFIQFYPVIIIPLLILLFPSSLYVGTRVLMVKVVGWYIIAKVFEHFDRGIYEVTGFISGHTLKHLAASMATLYIVRMFNAKYIKNIQRS